MKPLISVIVITYNSSKFIEECLDGIAAQKWSELELIISDDCSKDNTLDICRDWLSKNENRFIRTELISVPENTGTTANCNRGLEVAKGDWVKYCAGDDVLLPNCIKDNLNYIEKNSDIKVLFSYCRMYLNNTAEESFIGLNPGNSPTHIISDNITAEQQYKLLLVSNRIPFTPSVFYHRKTTFNYGRIDDNYKFSDDYQRWLSFTKNGIKLFFMEKETVKYRIHNNSISNHKHELVINPLYFKIEKDEWDIKNFSDSPLPWDIKLSKMHSWYVNQIFRIKFFNRKTKFNLQIFYILNRILNPFHYIIYIKSNYCKKYKENIFYKH